MHGPLPVTLCLLLAGAPPAVTAAARPGAAELYGRWQNGPTTNANYFPIAVWVQSPKNAARYKAAGINLYVGLWRGPTEEQLKLLREAGMETICAQSNLERDSTNHTIVGWMHGDEPDNAQSRGRGQGYGPPILPEVIVRNYERIRAADPTRPVLLNLGQGVAWDNYIGRGVRRNHPEDYPQYVAGADVVSFDIYPAVHSDPEIAGKLEYVARGVERLATWSGGAKPVWNCIEGSRISNTKVKPTPAQIKSEVWMSLVHGSRGIIYFVHQFEPTFNEAAVLDDPELLGALTTINRQVHELAPVLNAPGGIQIRSGPEGTATTPGPSGKSPDHPEVTSGSPAAPLAALVTRHGDATYVFAVSLGNAPTRGSFTLPVLGENSTVEVLNEKRQVSLHAGTFRDDFGPYEVHLYKVSARGK